MNLIAVEASSHVCSVCSFKSDELVNVIESYEQNTISKNLPMMIQSIMRDFTSNHKIDSFAISIGPGSFTSLRVSLSIIKGIAFSLKNKIIPINTFDYLNFQINNKKTHYIALSSYKDKCFIQKFNGNKRVGDSYIESIENLKSIKHDIYGTFKENTIDSNINFIKIEPNSIYLGQYAIKNQKQLLKDYNSEINPVYLSNIEYKKNVK